MLPSIKDLDQKALTDLMKSHRADMYQVDAGCLFFNHDVYLENERETYATVELNTQEGMTDIFTHISLTIDRVEEVVKVEFTYRYVVREYPKVEQYAPYKQNGKFRKFLKEVGNDIYSFKGKGSGVIREMKIEHKSPKFFSDYARFLTSLCGRIHHYVLHTNSRQISDFKESLVTRLPPEKPSVVKRLTDWVKGWNKPSPAAVRVASMYMKKKGMRD